MSPDSGQPSTTFLTDIPDTAGWPDPDTPPLDGFDAIWQPVSFWAHRLPDSPALKQGRDVWSYARLDGEVRSLCDWLVREEVQPGDRVLLLVENGFLVVAGMLACSRLGAWGIPLNARLSPREVDTIRDHARPRVALYAVSISDNAKAHGERHGAVEDGELASVGAMVWRNPEAVEPEPVSDDVRERIAALIYTSGTTGQPKGVMLTNRNLIFTASRTSATRKVGPGDVAYGVLPFAHIYGLAVVGLGTLYRGGAVMLAARFDPAEVARAFAEDDVSIFNGVPVMHAHLVDLAKQRDGKLDAPRLRYLSTGGASTDDALFERVRNLFGLPLHNGYGLTETSPTVSVTLDEDPQTDDTVGPLVPGVEVKIAGEGGKAMLTGDTGEICIRGPLVMKGYYRAPELTAEVIDSEGWFHSGDVGRLNERGMLYVTGRLKEVIIHSGFNIYPIEVESEIAAHSDVSICAVVGRQVAGNEEVIAFVQPVTGRTVDAETLSDFVRDRIAPYKQPAHYVIRETLPTTLSGKILKHQLHMED